MVFWGFLGGFFGWVFYFQPWSQGSGPPPCRTRWPPPTACFPWATRRWCSPSWPPSSATGPGPRRGGPRPDRSLMEVKSSEFKKLHFNPLVKMSSWSSVNCWCPDVHGSTLFCPVLRIRRNWFRVRFQHFRLNAILHLDPNPGFWWPKIEGGKIAAERKKFDIFLIKNCY